MTLRTSRKPWQEPKKLTPAQEAANQRSFRIFRLRGLWEPARILTEGRREAVQALIDEELVGLGAEAHGARYARMRAVWAEERRAREELEAELPF